MKLQFFTIEIGNGHDDTTETKFFVYSSDDKTAEKYREEIAKESFYLQEGQYIVKVKDVTPVNVSSDITRQIDIDKLLK